MLIASLVLAIVPLLGIAYIVAQGSFDTVDNLFYVLILLAMSGIFAANAMVEQRRRRRVSARVRGAAVGAGVRLVAGASETRTERGMVEDVLFFESPVGQPDKSIVTLRPDRGPALLLFFEGDLRNQLPAGHEVEVTYAAQNGANRVLALSYK